MDNSNQHIINALVMQRNEAMDRHAQAVAHIAVLTAQVEVLTAHIEQQNQPPEPTPAQPASEAR